MNIEKILNALATRERINPKVAWQSMKEATDNEQELCYLWKIPNKEYQNWYNALKIALPNCPSLDLETTYIVHSGAKAFRSNALGYSIFAQSLGAFIRDNAHNEIERIEQYKCEYAIDITDLMKGGE